MTKYSRQHGMMELRSYAPGDGGIAFTWVSENKPLGETLDEPVTESDVSEWLRNQQKHVKPWDGWDIVVFWKPGPDRRYWDVRLGQLVRRPFHTSNKLVMDGVTYEYHHTHSGTESLEPIHYHTGNTDFYDVTEGRKVKVENASATLGLCFFLNHESDFERSGHQIRTRA